MIDANKFVKILDWEDVSTMYKFRAQDSDGIFYYYDGQPDPDESQENFFAGSFNYIVGVENIPNLDWQNSLEERPKLPPRTEEEVIVKIDGEWKSGVFVQNTDSLEVLFFPFQGEEVAYKFTDDLKWKYLKDIEL